jgi:transcriptional regulator with XRE-family HTH domain
MNWIKKARTQAKLTQKQLCEKYQIPHRTLQDWENDKNTPPPYVMYPLLRCIAVDFGINLKDTDADKTYTLTYADGTPLNDADEAYVRAENEAKKVELIKIDSPNVRTYKCSSGFIFKAKHNKQILSD